MPNRRSFLKALVAVPAAVAAVPIVARAVPADVTYHPLKQAVLVGEHEITDEALEARRGIIGIALEAARPGQSLRVALSGSRVALLRAESAVAVADLVTLSPAGRISRATF